MFIWIRRDMSKKIMILAGEASGDLQGAHLAHMVRRFYPDVVFTGVGGPRMREQGVSLMDESSAWGIIGPWHAIRKLPFLLDLVKRLKKAIASERPDLLVLIDSPAINMRMALFAREQGVKTLYFFPPSAWYPSIDRVKKIASVSNYIIPAFSYSVETYHRAGIEVNYYGHPLIDMIDDSRDRGEVCAALNLSVEKQYIAIMPGSREQEVSSLMPVLVDTMRRFSKERPGVEFLLPVATSPLRKLIEGYVKSREGQTLPVHLFDGRSHELMKVSRLILMASGSASLEAAIFGTPMMILYKLAWPDWCIGKLFIKVPFIALPNLIVQRKVVPELIQLEVNGPDLVRIGLTLFDDTPERQRTIEDLKEVKNLLGEPGVLERIGKFVAHVCEKDGKASLLEEMPDNI
jgi:lipid-A-disaccharide synthase